VKALFAIADGFTRWIDSVAGTFVIWLERYTPPRVVKLVENESGEFVLRIDESIGAPSPVSEPVRISEGKIIDAVADSLSTALPGSRVELILQPDRFLFRPLDLPNRASEFLDGIVRTQIDRLTPWSASDAAFGWSKPAQSGADRITVIIAATALTLVAPYVHAIKAVGAHSIAVFTVLPEAEAVAVPVKVLEERLRGAMDVGLIRRAVVILFMAAGITAGFAIGVSAINGASVDTQQAALSRQIASIRAAAATSGDAGLGSVLAARRTLEGRKHDAPSSLIVLETLSKILPDHTYVTELRIEGNKLRLVGITRDAPSLIGLIEQSGRLSLATFFAPTTRSPSDQGERFHIEAQIQPLVSPRS
jgi:general secretion pathway protein L